MTNKLNGLTIKQAYILREALKNHAHELLMTHAQAYDHCTDDIEYIQTQLDEIIKYLNKNGEE